MHRRPCPSTRAERHPCRQASYAVLTALAVVCACVPLRAADPLPGPEIWTLKFTHELNSSMGNMTQHWTASGTGTLSVATDGNATGTGQLSATEHFNMLPSTTRTSGSGGFSCGGARYGDYLLVWFEKGEVAMQGTHSSPAGTFPATSTFDPESIVPGPPGACVLRREPGRRSVVVLRPGPGLVSTTEFELQPGTTIGKDPEPPPGTFPDPPNIWTLELNSGGTQAAPMGNLQGGMSGSAQFSLPYGDGPARGEGPLNFRATNMDGEGRLILWGEVKDGYLLFDSRATLTRFTAAHGSADYGDGNWFWEQLPVRIKVEDGEEVTTTADSAASGAAYTGQATWKLTGERLERWQVLVDGWDTHYVGDAMEACGVRVNWRMDLRITVGVKGGTKTFKEGKGQSSLPVVDPYSHPPGMYSVQVVPGIWLSATGKAHPTPYVNLPTYPVTGTVGGNEASLKLPGDNQEPIYKVDFKGTLDAKTAAKHYATGKGSNPRILRKEIKDVGVGVFPFSVRATLQDGWSTSDAPPDAFCGTKITVHKLDK